MFFGILVCTCGQERVKDDYADDTGDNFRKGHILCVLLLGMPDLSSSPCDESSSF